MDRETRQLQLIAQRLSGEERGLALRAAQHPDPAVRTDFARMFELCTRLAACYNLAGYCSDSPSGREARFYEPQWREARIQLEADFPNWCALHLNWELMPEEHDRDI